MIPVEYKDPSTLEEENPYYLMENQEDGSCSFSKVVFLSYSPTPVFVYVKNEAGLILNVPREELFEKCG
jgi:hypothetical protein